MEVKIESSKLITPFYEDTTPPPTSDYVPLTFFDTVTFDTHIALIYAYRSPIPSNAAIELGLKKVLAKYRIMAGRFHRNEKGERVVLLNDKGSRFIEASIDINFDQVMPLKTSPDILSLHPSLEGVEELMQVQLTRFNCGSLVVGFSWHHQVADGYSTSRFLVAWGRACRGLDIGPLPIYDRSFFTPRNPPIFKFAHKGAEYKIKNTEDALGGGEAEVVVAEKFHFTLDFLNKLRSKASSSIESTNEYPNKPYSKFVSLLAHLWRAITRARGLTGVQETSVRIAVNGRSRLKPRVPDEYYGNVVLWALPTARAQDLLKQPLQYAAKIVHDAIVNLNDDYFRSFIDFSKCNEGNKDIVASADVSVHVLSPNMEVNSWMNFPFYELDFGEGKPFSFMPTYLPVEGVMFVWPSFLDDGSMDAVIPLFQTNLDSFKKICYSMD
ncbi:agmatine coumaroyltransferase-2-like [Tripterygium wilfordii]|uniref:Agmatine coumaroyltransferase-2-like n=1 Tax=Tripterygium wilfordii TaxID=458696 RepID=A0A7J7DYV8_TRIWF|nr:agmatine hydroxycinnamoyltransferase 1-like [Tripterygium wilfordii]KAF5751565.1 agmatine coumaroyltransferase-2-like [Tripterygium wilfordii]